jgi:Calcineurin-like phosphoesterase
MTGKERLMRIGRGFVRRLVAPTALAYAVFAARGVAFAGNGTPFNPNSANELTIAVYGDSPYGTTPTDTAEFEATPAFIAAINGDPKIDLVLHVGDIHSGKQYCTEAYDQSIYELWTQFKDPLVYTPGDNEWTDCNKLAEGRRANSTPLIRPTPSTSRTSYGSSRTCCICRNFRDSGRAAR